MGKITWRRHEDELLLDIAEAYGCWDVVAAKIPRHTLAACKNRFARLQQQRRDAVNLARVIPPPRLVNSEPPRPPRCAPADHATSTSTARLVTDNELRSRISVLGVTGGLLGDPLPGRSALDKKRAGIEDDPPRVDYRFADLRPKPTLAGMA